jgi:hypothetical protein
VISAAANPAEAPMIVVARSSFFIFRTPDADDFNMTGC